MKNNFVFMLLIVSFSCAAMDHDVECADGQFTSQSFHEVRHSKFIDSNSYFLVDKDGNGLTENDLHLLRRVAHFATERFHEDVMRPRAFCFGIQAGMVVTALLTTMGHDQAAKLLFLPMSALGGALSYMLYPARETAAEEEKFITACRKIIKEGNFDEEMGDEQQAQALGLRGLAWPLIASRLALGKLHVPHGHYDQLIQDSDYYKPLKYVLAQSDSPLYGHLGIPVELRGNPHYVRLMMNLIKECEKRTE